MYNTEGVDVVTTITELRTQTSEMIELVKKRHKGVMVQRHNDPQAVLISWELYQRLRDEVDF
jgi:prevent-host-death family protein